MAEKNIKSRIVHKHDTAENWAKATSFIPMKGEIIVYDIDDNYNYERFKIGNGQTVVGSLPFFDDALKAEIEELGAVASIQSDWNQNDETQLDYIKNKPNEDDALILIAEMGLIDPISDEDGAIYTDENNLIYTL